jgi:RHS repeat-associated protein
VDDVGWTGYTPQPPAQPEPGPEAWKLLTYVYDASGRRIEKKYDGNTQVKYVYDGDSCIAEYDGSGNLLRKYIYGPGIDQPVSMIESGGSYAGTYYYHFDALGNVVALTNSNGNTVEVYEYDVYGKVGASDASHPNRFMFTGREFDKETGLYYYRARYYKAEIGRFLQADQVGYEAGMNLYAYCDNNPWNVVDPFGNEPNNHSDSNGYVACYETNEPNTWEASPSEWQDYGAHTRTKIGARRSFQRVQWKYDDQGPQKRSKQILTRDIVWEVCVNTVTGAVVSKKKVREGPVRVTGTLWQKRMVHEEYYQYRPDENGKQDPMKFEPRVISSWGVSDWLLDEPV